MRDSNLPSADEGDDDSDDGTHFVFVGEDVEVSVPSSFLSVTVDNDTGATCGSVVAASLAVDFAETQMLPQSPPPPSTLDEEDAEEVQNGLHGVLVDFSSFGASNWQEGDGAGYAGGGGEETDFDEDVVVKFHHIKRVSCKQLLQ